MDTMLLAIVAEIKAMMVEHNLDVKEVMPFENRKNDIEILSLAQIGVCIGNRHRDVKQLGIL